MSLDIQSIPAEIPVEMCYLGWQESLDKLKRLVEPNNASTPAELARKPLAVAGFVQCDASVGYSRQGFSIRAKLSNLANVVSYYVCDDNTVTPVAPRLLTTTVAYKL